MAALLYSSERVQQNFFRRIMKISCQFFVPETEVLEKANIFSIEKLIILNKMHWAGHLLRMDDSNLLKRAFYVELSAGKRPR